MRMLSIVRVESAKLARDPSHREAPHRTPVAVHIREHESEALGQERHPCLPAIAGVDGQAVPGDRHSLYQELAVGQAAMVLNVGNVALGAEAGDACGHAEIGESRVERWTGALLVPRRRGQRHVLLQAHPDAARRQFPGIERRSHDEPVVIEAAHDEAVHRGATQGLAHLLAAHPGRIAERGTNRDISSHENRIAYPQPELAESEGFQGIVGAVCGAVEIELQHLG